MMNENKLLSRATLFNSTADFILFFSALLFLNDITKSIYFAAYSVSIKSIGMGVGALVFPYIGNRISMKNLMQISIIFTILLILTLIAPLNLRNNTWIIIAYIFFSSFFTQIFYGVRESYSKSLGIDSEQRSLQAQILESFFGAQIIGPILGFFLALYLNPNISILIGIILNIIAFNKISKLKLTDKFEGANILRPFTYLKFNSPLTHIFIVRSILYWIPVGIFNFLVFPVIEKQYKLSGIYSAWVYVVIGLGSILSTFVLKDSIITKKFKIAFRIKEWFFSKKDFELAFLALTVLAITRFLFINLPNLQSYLLVGVLGGFANGLNAVSTQTIRRKLCDVKQHPEIIGLEVVVGRSVDWMVGTICLIATTSNIVDYTTGIIISGSLLMGLAFLMRSKSFRMI